MLFLLGLWRQLADVQIENPIEFVIGQGVIDALNLFLLVVKHGDFIGEFFHDFRDDCLGLASTNGWSFFGLGSEFQFPNQGIGISVHWGRGGKVASGDSDIVIVARGDWGGFLRTTRREKGHVNVHGWSCSNGGHVAASVCRWFFGVTTGTFEIKTPCRWCFWVLLLELLSHSTYQDAVGAKRKALVE
jgi:hypothetical protein